MEPNCLGAQESRALVAQGAGDKVHHRSDEDAATEADAQEQAVHILRLAQVLHLQQAHALRRGLQRLSGELFQGTLPLQGQDADGVVHTSHGHERRSLPVLWNWLHRNTQDLVVHVTLRHLVQSVALVNLEIKNLSARQGNNNLSFVRSCCYNSLLSRHPPLIRSPRKQVADACRVYLYVRVICHQLDEQGRGGGQKSTVQHLLNCVANGKHESDIYEGHHNVAVVLTVHGGLHRPYCIGLSWQFTDSHLRHRQAVSKNPQGGSRTATTHGVQLRLSFTCGI
mmetsp:Transcript_111790/g.266677  ORF Transcript_111790/g.266677 Transcript_111790/m.266677 type:complete len:282 (-) Transcript_111790:1289-2134(-)